MKDKIISVFFNGFPYGLIFFGLSFTLGYFIKLELQNSLLVSSFMGISALLVNGVLYNRFAKPLEKLEGISITLRDAELLLLQAPANHLIEDSMLPGKLFLTDKRVIFKVYEGGSISLQEYSWDLTQFRQIYFSKSVWNAGGEFIINHNDECTLLFEVNKLKLWKNALKSA